MADVAQLGIAVDSSQAKSATGDLKGLAAAASTAEQASTRLSAAGQKSETVLRSMDAAAKRAGVSTDEMRARTDSFNAATTKMAGASMTAQKALVTLSTQAKQTANDNQELGKQTEVANASFGRFATRFAGGLIAGASVAVVKNLAGYLLEMNRQLAATADIAQRTGIGGQQFQGLQTAAAYKGISGTDFNASMLAFNQQVDLAKNGLGDLKAQLSLNGKTVGDTATAFGTVADLIKNAGSDAQKFAILQSAGLPATREYVRLMEQGSEKIKLQASFATKLTDQQLEDAKRLDDKWNETATNFGRYFKQQIVELGNGIKNLPTPFAHQGTVVGGFLQRRGFDRPEDPNSNRNQGLDMLRRGMGNPLTGGRDNQLKNIYNATGAFGTEATTESKTKSLEISRMQNAQEQQKLALLGPLATAQDVVRQKQLEIDAAASNNIHLTDTQIANLKLLALAQFEQYRVQQQASIGVFDFAKAQKASNDNLQALVAQKLLDPNNAQQWAAAQNMAAKSLRELSDQASVAGSRLPGLQQAYNDATNASKQLDQFAVSSVGTLSSGLANIIDGTKSVGDGFKDLSKTIIRALEEAAIKALIVGPILKGATGLGSFLGFSDGGIVPAAKGFASGGFTGAGSKYQPAGIVHAGEFVFSQSAVNRIGVANLDRIHKGYADGGIVVPPTPSFAGNNDNQRTHVSVGVAIDDDGGLRAYVNKVSTIRANQAYSAAVNRSSNDMRMAGERQFRGV